MTNREIVEWVAQAQIGQPLPPGVSMLQIVDAMEAEAGFPRPALGSVISDWTLPAMTHARAVVGSETWNADGLK